MLFEYLTSAVIPPDLAAVFQRVTEYGQILLTEARDAGELRLASPSIMGAYIGGGIRNTLKWRRIDPSPLTDGERRAIADMCWAAISR